MHVLWLVELKRFNIAQISYLVSIFIFQLICLQMTWSNHIELIYFSNLQESIFPHNKNLQSGRKLLLLYQHHPPD